MSVRLQRATVFVADMERALAFWRDVLGFSVAYVLPPNPDSYSYLVFDVPRDAVMRFATLSTDTQPRAMALVELTGARLPPVSPPRRHATVLEVADPDAVVAGARTMGLHVYPEEVLHTPDGRTGREIGIVDADDNLVVIYLIASG